MAKTTFLFSAIWIATAHAVSAAAPEIQRLPPGKAAEMIHSYLVWDAQNNEGRGNSDRTTSGGLGWGESAFLRNYIRCYQVTRHAYWLDKVVDHFDRMAANLSDPDGDGRRSWQDMGYSVGIVQARAHGDVGDAEISPEVQRPYVNRGGEKVTGGRYLITFTSPSEFEVIDETAEKPMAKHAYKPPHKITEVPGATLVIKGKPAAGAQFVVETTAPERVEYQVHDGMATYPVAQFIEIVYTSPELKDRYLAKAEQYAELLSEHFFDRWEATWTDLPDGAGLYKFTLNPTQRFPGYSLPHNQFLALARTWLILQDVDGVERRAAYRDRAAKMARYFKQHLRVKGQSYEWFYWDPLPHEQDVRRHVEDCSHATIDIGFAIEATQRGVVFAEKDLRRFASTYVDVMWSGDRQRPRFGARVDTNENARTAWHEWVDLALVDRRIWPLAWAMYKSVEEPPDMAPAIARLYDQLVGLSDAERAECRRRIDAARQQPTKSPRKE